jgi:hypothetical protein
VQYIYRLSGSHPVSGKESGRFAPGSHGVPAPVPHPVPGSSNGSAAKYVDVSSNISHSLLQAQSHLHILRIISRSQDPSAHSTISLASSQPSAVFVSDHITLTCHLTLLASSSPVTTEDIFIPGIIQIGSSVLSKSKHINDLRSVSTPIEYVATVVSQG